MKRKINKMKIVMIAPVMVPIIVTTIMVSIEVIYEFVDDKFNVNIVNIIVLLCCYILNKLSFDCCIVLCHYYCCSINY